MVAVICLLLLCLIGLVGEQLVWWTIYSGWSLMKNTFSFAGGTLPESAVMYLSAGDWLCGELIYAYWFSYFWSASGALYLILRRSVDSTDLDELDSIENPVATTLPEIPSSPPAMDSETSPDDASS